MGPQIVSKAVMLVWTNLGAAIRATAVPFALMAAVPRLFLRDDSTGQGALQAGLVPVAVLSILLFAWGAVAWHRHVLLEEAPALLSRPPRDAFFEYLWASMRTFAFAFVLLILSVSTVGLVAGALATAAGNGGEAAFVVFAFGVAILITYALLRVSLVLPAAALDRRMSLRQSWRITRSARNAVLVVALLAALVQAALEFVGAASAGVPLLGFVLSLLLTWASAMIGLSILTALYGVLVEGRPVD